MTDKNIVLIGFMGTGKSSVGKALAAKLDRPWVDVDRLIEQRERRALREIFEKDGEPRFRALEKAALAEATRKTGQVITTGGGAVLDPENRLAMKKNGVVVALLAAPETVYQRVRHSDHRPLLKRGADLLSEIRRLMEQRRPYYEEADLSFETDGKNAGQVAPMILAALEKMGEVRKP